MLWLFNTVHVGVTPTTALFLLLLHDCNCATVIDYIVNILGERKLAKGVTTRRLRTTHSGKIFSWKEPTLLRFPQRRRNLCWRGETHRQSHQHPLTPSICRIQNSAFTWKRSVGCEKPHILRICQFLGLCLPHTLSSTVMVPPAEWALKAPLWSREGYTLKKVLVA